MDLSSKASKEEEIHQRIIRKLKDHFEAEVDLQKFKYYVHPLAETNLNSKDSLCLLTEVNKFVASEHLCSLLVLGDSGNGKSLLGQYVVWQLWKEYQPDKIIPLFVHLPLIPQGSRAQELLESYLKSAGLNEDERIQLIKKNKLLLVLDGYDEIPEIGNLYKQNHWEKLKVKMMTTCRPEALLQRQTGNSYQELFLPKGTETHRSQDRFVEFHLKKFNLEQIDKYLKQYVSLCEDHHPEDWKTYKQNLTTVPGVLELVATPFILSIVVQVLPRMIKKCQNQELHDQRKLVRVDIYDYFVDDWFDFQVERFREQGKLNSLTGDLKHYLKSYSQNLAYKALIQGRLEITFKDQETLNPELLRPKDHSLLSQYTSDLPRFTEEAMKYIRSGCLLKTGQSYFSFLHKSLIEYFAAQDLFTGIHLSTDLYTQQILEIENLNQSLSLNENLLVNEPAIIKILADRVETDAIFKQLLYDVIEFSKRQPFVEIAAANAITILNVSGESFSDKDFSYIRIPNANLSGAICDQTNFSHADLRGVCFLNAWLKGSNFSNAQMSDIDFAELPGIENSDFISSFCIAPDGKFILIGDLKTRLSKWCLTSGKMEWKESISPFGKGNKLLKFLGFLSITELAISPDGKKVAVNVHDGVIHVWDIAERKQISLLIPNTEKEQATVFNIQFCSPDGKRLIFYEEIKGLQMWDLENNQFISSFGKTDRSEFAVSCDWKFLVSYDLNSSPGPLSLYDLTTLSLQSTQILNKKYKCCCFSPSARYFGAVVEKSQIQILDLTNNRTTKTFYLGGVDVKRIFFSPDEYLLGGMSDDKFYFWHTDSGMYLYDLAIPFTSSLIKNVSSERNWSLFSPINQRHLFYPIGNQISAWCVQTTSSPLTKRLSQFQPYGFQEEYDVFEKKKVLFDRSHGIFEYVSFCTEPLEVEVSFSRDLKGHLEVIEPQRTRKFSLSLRLWPDFCLGLGFLFSLSQNRRYLAFALLDQIWEEIRVKFIPAASTVRGLVGRLAHDTDIRVFDLEKDQLLHTFSHSNQIHYMSFSKDNEWLVTTGNTVRIWDLSSGKCLHKYNQHKDGAKATALTSNKRFLAIADGASSISIWDTSTHKSILLSPQLPFRMTRITFIKNDSFLLCETDEKDQLLFRFHYDGEKGYLSLIESSRYYSFNCSEANVKGVYGLSNENQRLLHQKGAIGKPSELSAKPQSKNSLLHILKLNSPPQPAVKIRVGSILSSKAPILYDNWIISLMRKPSGKEPEHVFLAIEGLDQFGKGVLGRIDLVDDRQKAGYALIVEKCFHDIPPNDLNNIFWKDLVNYDEVYSKSWSVPRSKVLHLLEDVEKDKEKEIKYFVLGNSSIFGKSSSKDGHNCFTWLREKLFSLNEEKIEKDLKGKWTDSIVAKPSLYLPPPDK